MPVFEQIRAITHTHARVSQTNKQSDASPCRASRRLFLASHFQDNKREKPKLRSFLLAFFFSSFHDGMMMIERDQGRRAKAGGGVARALEQQVMGPLFFAFAHFDLAGGVVGTNAVAPPLTHSGTQTPSKLVTTTFSSYRRLRIRERQEHSHEDRAHRTTDAHFPFRDQNFLCFVFLTSSTNQNINEQQLKQQSTDTILR